MPKVSLIISFYNKLNTLELLFTALEKQSFKDFEVIIADDGSESEVVKKISELIAGCKFKTHHIWHEDKGWRKNSILNKAILKSNTGYLIFIDGDCIPHPRFIEEHYNNRKEATVLAGRRVNLSVYISDRLSINNIKKGYLQHIFLLLSFLFRLFGKGSHTENGLYFKSKFLRKHINNKERGILGSNFSVHKSDILNINGFDERFIYPGAGEDTDIRNRFKNYGIKIETLKHIAIQYHLYHKPLDRNKGNLEILEENIINKVTFTPYGIKK